MTELTKKIWHVNGAPWEQRSFSGATINIGSEDPHLAIGFIDIPEQDGLDREHALALAKYICQIHNERLVKPKAKD